MLSDSTYNILKAIYRVLFAEVVCALIYFMCSMLVKYMDFRGNYTTIYHCAVYGMWIAEILQALLYIVLAVCISRLTPGAGYFKLAGIWFVICAVAIPVDAIFMPVFMSSELWSRIYGNRIGALLNILSDCVFYSAAAIGIGMLMYGVAGMMGYFGQYGQAKKNRKTGTNLFLGAVISVCLIIAKNVLHVSPKGFGFDVMEMLFGDEKLKFSGNIRLYIIVLAGMLVAEFFLIILELLAVKRIQESGMESL